MLTRRALGAGLAALPMVARAADKPVRLGLQKAGSLVLLRQQGVPGLGVEWVEFNSGPAIMEAINAGAVDFAGCGDTPPIFAPGGGGGDAVRRRAAQQGCQYRHRRPRRWADPRRGRFARQAVGIHQGLHSAEPGRPLPGPLPG